MKVLIYIHAFICISINICYHGYEINNKENEISILYLRKINNAKTSCGHRSIEYLINLEKIYQARNDIIHGIELIQTVCEQARFPSLCELVINEIKIEKNIMNSKYKNINSATAYSEETSRKKRNTNELTEYLQKTISVIDIGYSDMRRNIEEMGSFISLLTKSQNNLKRNIEYINFNMLSNVITLNIKRHINLYDDILKIILNKDLKTIIEWINPTNFRKELSKLEESVNKNQCETPSVLRDIDTIDILRKATIETSLTKNDLSIIIGIPLILKHRFELIEAVPLPFTIESKTYIVQPSYPYYLIYRDAWLNTTYAIPMTNEERNNCKTFATHVFCKPQKSIQTIGTSDKKQTKYFFIQDYDKIESYKNTNKILPEREFFMNLKRIPHLNQMIK